MDALTDILSYAESKLKDGEYVLVANALKQAFNQKQKPAIPWSHLQIPEPILVVLEKKRGDTTQRIEFQITKCAIANRRAPGYEYIVAEANRLFYENDHLKDERVVKLYDRFNTIYTFLVHFLPDSYTLTYNGIVTRHDKMEHLQHHAKECIREHMITRECERQLGIEADDDDTDWCCFDSDIVFHNFIKYNLSQLVESIETTQFENRPERQQLPEGYT